MAWVGVDSTLAQDDMCVWTKVGDKVFIIVSCQQPLFLRECPDGNSQYSVVGECICVTWRVALAVSFYSEISPITSASKVQLDRR